MGMSLSLAQALKAGAARLDGEQNIAFSNQADKERYQAQIKANRQDIINYNRNKLGNAQLDADARKTLLGQGGGQGGRDALKTLLGQ